MCSSSPSVAFFFLPACSIEPTEAGDYKLCFDNSFSTISEKLVFFELIFDSPQEDEDLNSWAEMAEPEEMLDIKIEDIKVGREIGEDEKYWEQDAGFLTRE